MEPVEPRIEIFFIRSFLSFSLTHRSPTTQE
jgi:hypothetical protein